MIFCGGNRRSNSILISSRLVCAVEHLQDRVLFFLEAEVLQPDRLLDHPVHLAQVALLLPAVKSGRIRIGSARAELETRLSANVTMRTLAADS